MELTVNSGAGTGEDDFLQCVADVVSTLVGAPQIKLMRSGIDILSTTGVMLTYSLPDNEEGSFTCSVCINVSEAGILDHCSMTRVLVSSRAGK